MSTQDQVQVLVDRLRRGMDLLEELSEELEQGTRALASAGHLPLIHHFVQVSALWDRLNDMKKKYNGIYDLMSYNLVPDALKAQEIKFIKINGVGRVGYSTRISCSIVDETPDKAKAYDWLRSHDYGSIIKPTVNSSTMGATAKEYIETKGKELPDDLFKVNYQTVTSIKA